MGRSDSAMTGGIVFACSRPPLLSARLVNDMVFAPLPGRAIAPCSPAVLEFLSWDRDTEEAQLAFMLDPSGALDGTGGFVVRVICREECIVREMVRRWNACAPPAPPV